MQHSYLLIILSLILLTTSIDLPEPYAHHNNQHGSKKSYAQILNLMQQYHVDEKTSGNPIKSFEVFPVANANKSQVGFFLVL